MRLNPFPLFGFDISIDNIKYTVPGINGILTIVPTVEMVYKV